jgi:N-carbamoyl-L-amino-acid hydrolase
LLYQKGAAMRDKNRMAMTRREFAAVAATLTASAAIGRVAFGAEPPLRVNGARLNGHLAELMKFGTTPEGGVSRVAYSEANRDALAVVTRWMREANLEPSLDLAGNLLGRRAGRISSLKPLVIGSHIDSVPEGGNYDGNVGSMAALEVAQSLADHKVTLRHPLEVAIWSNEEGGLFGSRAVSGDLPANELDLLSASGKTIREGIAFLGGDASRIGTVQRAKGDIAAYVEMHIEQGGILDAEKLNIGIVEGIVGIRRWDVIVTGFANHAGTTPMDQRRDALVAAARFIDAVSTTARRIPGRQVATIGKIRAFPGAPNVIPGRVECTLEIRDLEDAKMLSTFDSIRKEAMRIGTETNTTFELVESLFHAPAPTDLRVRALIADAAKGLGLSTRTMPSGAGHDAQTIARLGPVGMIFVPSLAGISHAPKEFSRPEDITNGANVLLEVVQRLDAWK